jgi:hypothetical protein
MLPANRTLLSITDTYYSNILFQGFSMPIGGSADFVDASILPVDRFV